MPDKVKRFLFPRKHSDLLCPNVKSSHPADYHLLPPSEGKANPVQAWTGPEGSRKLRLPDFMTIGT